jgi:hypothetical protein
MSHCTIINGIALAICLYFLTAPEALAYVDPSTGSYIVQILIGGLVTVGFTVKTFWHNLKAFFCKQKPGDANKQPEDVVQSATMSEQSPS